MTPGLQKDIKAAKMLGTAIVAFVVATMPANIYFVVIGFKMLSDENNGVMKSMEQIIFMTLLGNSGMNFIIYAWKDRHFRQAYKKLVQCKT